MADCITAAAIPLTACYYTNEYCSVDSSLFAGFNSFKVFTYGWPDDPRGCLLGVLDNVRGQTSGAEGAQWNCGPNGSGGRRMSFTVSTVYLDASARVAGAIKLASPGGYFEVTCQYYSLRSSTACDYWNQL